MNLPMMPWKDCKTIKDKQHIDYMVEMLNRDLKKKLEKKKQRREKMRIKDQPWL